MLLKKSLLLNNYKLLGMLLDMVNQSDDGDNETDDIVVDLREIL